MRNVLLLFLTVIGFSACQRAEKDQTSLTFSLDGITANSTSSLSDMNCFGVFVSAPDINLTRNQCSYATETALNEGGFLYASFYGPFYKSNGAVGSQITLSVPNGDARTLRLIGIKVDTSTSSSLDAKTACEQFKEKPTLYSQFMDSFFTIAESKPVNLKGDDVNLEMTAVYDSSKQISTCSGLGLDPVTSGGVPVKLAVHIQDDRISASNKVVSSNNCIGVKFQLQDALSKPVTSTVAIPAVIDESVLGLSIGSFYYPIASPATDICSAVNLVPVSSGKISISFAAGTTDTLLYFRPSSASLASRTITVSSPNLRFPGSDTLNYIAGTRAPTKYAFYDLFNNVSSVKSKSSDAATLRRGQCRLGAVQFLDQYETPFERTTNSNSPDAIRISAWPVGSVDFFPSQSACVAGSSPLTFQDIAMSMNTSATGFGFFYKVNATAPSAVSFTIKNQGLTAYPVISAGDLSSSDNTWRVVEP